MSTNPFFSEDSGPIEEPTESEEAATEPEDQQEEAVEEEESPLFTEEESSEDLFEDTEPEETPDTIPYKRFQKVISERNQQRDANAELSESLARVEGQLSELHGYKDLLSNKYQGFKDPLGQASWDADFVSALENVAKTDTDVAQSIQKVMNYLETGNMPQNNVNEPVETVSEPDPKIQRLLEKTMKSDISEALPADVKPAFKNVFTDYALANLDADASTADIQALAKEFIADKGFTKDDVFNSVKSSPKKPVTASQAKADTTPRSTEAEADTERETPQGTREERAKKWQSNRDKIFRDTLG